MIMISPILLAVFLIALICFIVGWGFYGGIVIGLNYIVGGCLGAILWFICPGPVGSTFVGVLAGTVAGTVYGITLDGYLAGCIIGFAFCLFPALIVCLCLYEFVLLLVYEFAASTNSPTRTKLTAVAVTGLVYPSSIAHTTHHSCVNELTSCSVAGVGEEGTGGSNTLTAGTSASAADAAAFSGFPFD